MQISLRGLLGGILSFFLLVSPLSPVSFNKEESMDENRMEIKVATYNIHNGGDVDYDFSVIANDILENGIEIIGIQEVDTKTNRNKRQNTMKILSDLTGYEYYKYTRCLDFDGGGYGTGILSKYPIESYRAYVLESDCHEQRMLGHVSIDVSGVLIDFFNTHLSWESRDTRTKQFANIAEKTAGCDYFIVTGDFNTPDFSEFDQIIGGNLVNNENTKMISCGGDGAIDNIVYSGKFKVEECGVLDVDHSDHEAVWAVLSFALPETVESE